MPSLFTVLFLALSAWPLAAQDCSPRWERFSNAPLIEIALPDTYVSYWRYRFEVRDGQPFVLRVRGKFPHARYMNYNVYDQETLDTTGALTDFKMVADPGSQNPFLPAASRLSTARDYTAWVIPQESNAAAISNALAMPSPIPEGQPKAIELWYRIYAPDEGQGENGGVALPTIEAFTDTSAQTPLECPAERKLSPALWRALGNLPPKGTHGELRTYASKPSTMYANFDTRYVISGLNFRAGAIAVLRFKPPTVATTFKANPIADNSAQVRYWSLCIGGASTRTSTCIADYQAVLGNDGYVNLVIANEALRSKVEALQVNFLPIPTFIVPLLIYRNLLPTDFTGNFGKIAQWNADVKRRPNAAVDFDASNFIGDYAPQGQHCSEDDFFSNYCGVPLSFPAPTSLSKETP